MKLSSPRIRALMAAVAVTATIGLAGCETDTLAPVAKALKPLSPQMLADLERKSMPKESPLLVRLFKEEAELEIWKQDTTGQYALLKTYPICRWSGELGPKIKQGDRQAPEGFYNITQAQLNPNSSYYLSFDLGYPNAYDRAHGRTGSHLMVHGDCTSSGCYAMTDEQVSEIYGLAREAFFGGQRSFQVQAYPFRMTALNMARHRNNPNMPFWKMLKEGYDHFEVTRAKPKVDVCEKRYVFNAQAPGNASPNAALSFNAAGRCPVFRVPSEIATPVAAKAKRDEIEIASLIQKGTPASPIRTGSDGGMNKLYLAKLRPRPTAGGYHMVVDTGTGPVPVNPPKEAQPVFADATSPVPTRAKGTTKSSTPAGPQLASAESKPVESPGFFSRIFKWGSDEPKPKPSTAPAPTAAPKAAPTRPATTVVAATPKPSPRRDDQAAEPKVRSAALGEDAASASARSTPDAGAPPASGTPGVSSFSGSSTAPPTGSISFDSRWGALR